MSSSFFPTNEIGIVMKRKIMSCEGEETRRERRETREEREEREERRESRRNKVLWIYHRLFFSKIGDEIRFWWETTDSFLISFPPIYTVLVSFCLWPRVESSWEKRDTVEEIWRNKGKKPSESLRNICSWSLVGLGMTLPWDNFNFSVKV